MPDWVTIVSLDAALIVALVYLGGRELRRRRAMTERERREEDEEIADENP